MAWFQLLRVSALPSALSNVLAGFLIANGSWQPGWKLSLLVAASGFLYMSGMALNDWWDSETDRKNQKQRPIPSGRISSRAALTGYLVLSVLGLVSAWCVSTRSFYCSVALVLAILLYDCVLKRARVAPLLMGSCRALNILLGASIFSDSAEASWLGFAPSTIWISLSLGILVSGITWFARNENQATERGNLIGGTTAMSLGIVGFILAPLVFEIAISLAAIQRYIAIVGLISLPIFLRAVQAIKLPSAATIGMTIGTAIRSLILFDAAIAYLFSQCQILYPLAILTLLLPALLLSRWISPT